MSSRAWSGKNTKEIFSAPLPFLIIVTIIALVVGGAIGILGLSVGGGIVGAIIMMLILIFRKDELAATVVIAVSVYVDWYLAYTVIALLLVIMILIFFYLNRSPQRLWVEPRALWVWFLFLALAIFPAINGALTVHDTLLYYPGIVFGAFIMFWLGTLIAQSSTSALRFYK